MPKLQHSFSLVDAERLGSQCSKCPFSPWDTSLPSTNLAAPRPSKSSFVILDGVPTHSDCVEGKVLSGGSRYELKKQAQKVGLRVEGVHTTAAVLCRKKNFTKGELKEAIACCRPRVLKEIGNRPVLALGEDALRSITYKHVLGRWRGSPLQGRTEGSVLPTWALWELRVNPARTPIFAQDLSRMKLLAEGKLEWKWPEIILESGQRAQEALLSMREKIIGFDIETAGMDPVNDDILCVGLATKEIAVSLKWPLPESEERLIRDLLADPNSPKAMHNGQHDVLGMQARGYDFNGYQYDTLLMHAAAMLQLPHDLGFVASCEFWMPRWKSIFKVMGDEKGLERFLKAPPEELRDYNAKDAYMTARLVPSLLERLKETHNGWELYQEYFALANIAMRMRAQGWAPNEGEFEKQRETLKGIMNKMRQSYEKVVAGLIHVVPGAQLKTKCHVYIGPYRLGESGSHGDIKKLYFEELGLPPPSYTELGEPQLNAKGLEEFCADPDKRVATLSRTILNYRKAAKLLSTYVDGMPINKVTERVHPSWKVYGTVTGRWSSSDPNCQNIPKKMRPLFKADTGTWIVSADYSQLELRIIAYVAQDRLLMQWYEEGQDVHLMNARTAFNKPDATKKGPERQLAKALVYGPNYGGTAKTIWIQNVAKFPGLTLSVVEDFVTGWFKAHPDIVEYQRKTIQTAKDYGYVEAPLSGRREIFHDGRIDPNKVLNYPFQSTAGDVVNRAILGIDRELDWTKEAIKAQVHDDIVLQGPDPLRLWQLLKKHMEKPVTLYGQEVIFPCEPEIGKVWGDQTETLTEKAVQQLVEEAA